MKDKINDILVKKLIVYSEEADEFLEDVAKVSLAII